MGGDVHILFEAGCDDEIYSYGISGRGWDASCISEVIVVNRLSDIFPGILVEARMKPCT